jgi:hypothetical protein
MLLQLGGGGGDIDVCVGFLWSRGQACTTLMILENCDI